MFKWITGLFKPNKLRPMYDEDTLPQYISEYVCGKLMDEFPDSDWNIITNCEGGDEYPVRIILRHVGRSSVRTIGTVINGRSIHDHLFVESLWTNIRHAIEQVIALEEGE